MNSWLGKKLQNQFHSQEVSKKALTKLQQLENRNNVCDVETRTSGETSSRCPNCSTTFSQPLSLCTNNINITISHDLLANTNLGNLTTLEEVSRDPGFQEFLSAQLQLYYKFITNSSSNNILSTAKSRASSNEDVQSSNSTLPAHQNETLRPVKRSVYSSTTQKEALRQLDLNTIHPLSLIEEEDSRRVSENFLRDCDKVQNATRDRSPLKGTSKVVTSVKPSRKTQRSKETPDADASVTQKPLLDTERRKPARKRSPVKLPESGADITSTRLNRSSRSRVNSVSAIAENTEQPKQATTATERKGSRKPAANETSTVNAQQSDDDVFKVPVPPKSKVSRSRSNSKRNDTTVAKAAVDQSDLVELQSSGDGVFKAPLPLQPKVPRPGSKETETIGTSYRSRTGRVSKPPGSFWNPPGEGLLTGSKAVGNQSKLLDADKKSKKADKRTADTSLSGMESESGYSSLSASGRKTASSRKMCRVEAVKAHEVPLDTAHNSSEIHTKQTQTKPRGRRNRAQDTELDATTEPKNSQEIEKVDQKINGEKVKPPRKRGRPRLSEKTLVENKEQIDPKSTFKKVAAARSKVQTKPTELDKLTTRTAELDKLTTRTDKAQGAVSKYIFSSSSSDDSDVDACLLSNTTAHYDPIRREEVDATQIVRAARQVYGREAASRLSVLGSSSDETEVVEVRKPVRKKADPPRIADSKHTFTQPEDDSDSGSDDVPVHKKRTVKNKKRAVVKQPQVTKATHKTSLDSETSPLLNPNHKKRSGQKGRYLFSGSSSEDDSICSNRKNGKNRNDPDNESFVDDASYVSSTRSTRGEQNNRGRPSRKGNDNRQPRLVSRFRL